MTKLSLIIPAYNEEKRLPSSITKIIDYFSKIDYLYEIIVVDDASDIPIAQYLPSRIKVIRNLQNKGKGFSVKQGVLAATGEYIFFSDADLSTPISEIDKLLTALDHGADVSIGSRGLLASDIQVAQPIWRQTMGKMFNVLVRLLILPGIYDTQCGFKGFKREIAKKVFPQLTIEGFGFDIEVLFLAKKYGAQVIEIPIAWKNDKESTVNPFTDSLKMLVDIFKIRFSR